MKTVVVRIKRDIAAVDSERTQSILAVFKCDVIVCVDRVVVGFDVYISVVYNYLVCRLDSLS